MNDHKIYEDQTQLYQFMDSDNDGLVDYQEYQFTKNYSFVRFVLPQSTEIRQLVLLRESYIITDNMFLPQ